MLLSITETCSRRSSRTSGSPEVAFKGDTEIGRSRPNSMTWLDEVELKYDCMQKDITESSISWEMTAMGSKKSPGIGGVVRRATIVSSSNSDPLGEFPMSLVKSSMSSKRESRSGEENSEEHEGVAFSSGSVVEDRGIGMHCSSFGRLVCCCSVVRARLGVLVRFKLVSSIYLGLFSMNRPEEAWTVLSARSHSTPKSQD